MSGNPYESPREVSDDSKRSPSTPSRPVQVVLPLLWAVFLFLGLPAVQHIPLVLRIGSSLITIAAISRLPGAARGWGHLFVAPLYAILILLQIAVWAFPF
jgi:hypothetical protein